MSQASNRMEWMDRAESERDVEGAGRLTVRPGEGYQS